MSESKPKVPLTVEEVYERYKDNPEITYYRWRRKGIFWKTWHRKMSEDERMEYRKEILKWDADQIEENEVLRNFYFFDRWHLTENYRRKFRKLCKISDEYETIYLLYDKTNFENEELLRELEKLEPLLLNEYKRAVQRMLREKGKGGGGGSNPAR